MFFPCCNLLTELGPHLKKCFSPNYHLARRRGVWLGWGVRYLSLFTSAALFPCSSPWESNVFPHTKGGSSEICQESGECVCWTHEETSLGGFEDNGAWALAMVYFVHAKHFTRTRGNSRTEQSHNISLSYWKGLFHLCHPISAMIALRELCLHLFLRRLHSLSAHCFHSFSLFWRLNIEFWIHAQLCMFMFHIIVWYLVGSINDKCMDENK